jgi:hypothetical protein
MKYDWTCQCCGTRFDTLPMDYMKPAPDNWFALPEAEREARARLNDDLCVIDGKEFYARGCIEIPVIDSDELFVWGAWVSISKESFRYILDHWEDAIPDDEPPFAGELCSRFTGYPETAGLRCSIHIRKEFRPRIVLESPDYPMAVEQRSGITLERIKQIAAEDGHG